MMVYNIYTIFSLKFKKDIYSAKPDRFFGKALRVDQQFVDCKLQLLEEP